MKKLISLFVVLVLLVSTVALSTVAFADGESETPRTVTFDQAKFDEYLDEANKQVHFEMSGTFMLSNNWLKDSAKVAEVFPGINYKVSTDEGYSSTEKYDKIYVEYCTPSEDIRPGEGETDAKWANERLATSTISAKTAGVWNFRYVVKSNDGEDRLAVSSIITMYGVDTTHPVVALSESQNTRVTNGLTVGTTYTISTALSITDASSTTTTYEVYRYVNGKDVKIYDSVTREVAAGHESVISTSGVITPVESDVLANKQYAYKIVYTVKDSYGFHGVMRVDATDEFHPEMKLFVNHKAEVAKEKQQIEGWKIALYVVAGVAFVGIIALLFIKPKKATATDGRINYGATEANNSDDNNDANE